MKVAITVWEDRISPVFDASRRMLIAEIEDNRIVDRIYATLNPGMPTHLVASLIDMGVQVLICGAISSVPANIITSGGIQLIAFIAGEVEQVLWAYAAGTALDSVFCMPGCRPLQRDKGNWNL